MDNEHDIGHRTIRKTFDHIILNMELWSDDLAQSKPDDQNEQRRLDRSLKGFDQRLTVAAAALKAEAHSIVDKELWDETWTDPISAVVRTYGGTVAHVITHSMHHRSQLLYLLRLEGAEELPDGDILTWEESTQSPELKILD